MFSSMTPLKAEGLNTIASIGDLQSLSSGVRCRDSRQKGREGGETHERWPKGPA